MNHPRTSSLVVLAGLMVPVGGRAQGVDTLGVAEQPTEPEAYASAPEIPHPATPPEAATTTAPTSGPVVETEFQFPLGTVVGLRGNDAVVDVGESAGVRMGVSVRLYLELPVDLGDGETAYERQDLGVGTVTALSTRRCLVRLGNNEVAPVGARAVVVVTPTAGFVAMVERATVETTTGSQPRPRDASIVRGISVGVSMACRF